MAPGPQFQPHTCETDRDSQEQTGTQSHKLPYYAEVNGVCIIVLSNNIVLNNVAALLLESELKLNFFYQNSVSREDRHY